MLDNVGGEYETVPVGSVQRLAAVLPTEVVMNEVERDGNIRDLDN